MSTVRRSLPLLSGTLFGAGLALSGMTDPERVRGFLDVFDRWDPTLAFVMAAAALVMAVAWRLQRRLRTPLLARAFSLPDDHELDAQLIAGSALFGVGWGLAGLCPGPGIALIASAPAAVLPFLLAMLVGMAAHRLVPAFPFNPQAQGA